MLRCTRPETPILAGISVRHSYFIEEVIRHEEHEINAAFAGEGVYRMSGGRTLPLRAGEILLLPAGVRHGIEVPQGLRMAVIHVHPDAFREIRPATAAERAALAKLRRPDAALPLRRMADATALTACRRIAEDAMVEQHRPNPGRAALLRALAAESAVLFLRLLLRADEPAAADEATRRILAVRDRMDRRFSEPLSLAQLAREAGLAPTYFAERFRRIVGEPPMAYLRARRIEQARFLLQHTAEPVKVVAWSAGFRSPEHFNNAFRRAVGRTPLGYRRAAGRAPSSP